MNLKLPFFSLIFSVFAFFFLTTSVSAQTLSTPSAYTNSTIPNSVYINQSPQYASMALYNFGHALSCIIMGSSPIAPCLEYKFIKNTRGMVTSIPVLASVNTSGGLLGMGESMLTMLYTEKPIDNVSFFAYMGNNLGIINKAHAQVGGSGNQVLSPVFALWTVSRNFAYLIMIIVFIAVGFMVMFRQKLNPQTVVSVQMALPGLVIGLILITFSYFLASLITDMAYIGTDLVGYYFGEAVKVSENNPPAETLTTRLSDQNPITVGGAATGILDKSGLYYIINYFFSHIPGDPTNGTFNGQKTVDTGPSLLFGLTPQSVVRLFAAGLTYMMYNTFLSPVGDLLGAGGTVAGTALSFTKYGELSKNVLKLAGTLVGGLPTTIAGGYGLDAYRDPAGYLSFWILILTVIILLYTIVRLAFRLINSYLSIIFLTISSPFVFLASSIPGRQGMAMEWVKNMLCNVLAFPAVIAVFYFAAFLVGNNPQIPGFDVTNGVELTNATGNLPFLGGINLEFLRKVLAFVAILSTPTIPDVICKSIGKPSAAGAAVAGAIGGAIAGGQKYEGQMSGQIQKAGTDIGSWRQALFGSQPIQAGRAGEGQMVLAQIRRGSGVLEEDPQAVGNLEEIKATMENTKVPRWRRALARAEYATEVGRRGMLGKAPASQGMITNTNKPTPFGGSGH